MFMIKIDCPILIPNFRRKISFWNVFGLMDTRYNLVRCIRAFTLFP